MFGMRLAVVLFKETAQFILQLFVRRRQVGDAILRAANSRKTDHADDLKAQRDSWQKQAETSQRLLVDQRPRRGLFGSLKAG